MLIWHVTIAIFAQGMQYITFPGTCSRMKLAKLLTQQSKYCQSCYQILSQRSIHTSQNLLKYNVRGPIKYPEKSIYVKKHPYDRETHKKYAAAMANLKAKKRKGVGVFVENINMISDLVKQGLSPSYVFYVKVSIMLYQACCLLRTVYQAKLLYKSFHETLKLRLCLLMHYMPCFNPLHQLTIKLLTVNCDILDSTYFRRQSLIDFQSQKNQPKQCRSQRNKWLD